MTWPGWSPCGALQCSGAALASGSPCNDLRSRSVRHSINDSPIKNDIVALLRKYGGKANHYDKNGKRVGKGKGDLND